MKWTEMDTNMTDVVPLFQSSELQVYVQVLRNEFVSKAFDAFSDPIVEINTLVNAANVDGIITDFPQTATAYRKNRCLKMEDTPVYMMPAQPGGLITLLGSEPEAVAPTPPTPVLATDDVGQPALPPVQQNTSSPTSSPSAGQHAVAVSYLLSLLALIVAVPPAYISRFL